MPVAPANPHGGLAAPVAGVHAAVAVAPVPAAATPVAAAAVGTNHGVCGRDSATQHQQALVAVGNIGNLQVIPTGIHGRNPDHVALLAQMNQEVARAGIANLNLFLPSADVRHQARLKAVLTSANHRYSAALANGRSMAASN